jgi:hypothetical protein
MGAFVNFSIIIQGSGVGFGGKPSLGFSSQAGFSLSYVKARNLASSILGAK